jgi:hypothetical protein
MIEFKLLIHAFVWRKGEKLQKISVNIVKSLVCEQFLVVRVADCVVGFVY